MYVCSELILLTDRRVVKLQNCLRGTDSLIGLPQYELAPYLELVCRLWIQQITTNQDQQMAVLSL